MPRARWPPGRSNPSAASMSMASQAAGCRTELGGRQAVAITFGIRWRGFPAWLIARTYHLLLMPGLGRRLRLLVDWNVALLFGRDSSSPGRLGAPPPLEGP